MVLPDRADRFDDSPERMTARFRCPFFMVIGATALCCPDRRQFMGRKQEYHDRVNRVLDYIAQHPDGELSLATLSRISGFSPFHFHRIFQGITGETLNSHVRRVRLEKA